MNTLLIRQMIEQLVDDVDDGRESAGYITARIDDIMDEIDEQVEAGR